MKKTMLLCLALALLAACNTIQGAGEDLRGAGEGIADTASKVKKKINQ